MAKQKYKFNPERLSYEEVRIGPLRRLFNFALWLAPTLLLSFVLTYVFVRRIDSPIEKELMLELKKDRKEVERLLEDVALFNDVLDDIQKRDEDLYRATLYADEFPEELKYNEESSRYAYLSEMSNGELLKKASEEMDILAQRINQQSLSFRELLKLAKDKEAMLSCIPAIQPVRNSELKRMVSGFGYRIDPIYKTRRMHTGMDFTADTGTEVYATGDGVVEVVETKRWGYGKNVVINHGYGYKTLYAHLSAFKVRRGQKIKRGELIGLIGSTGKSTGPHLHYEVIKNGKKVNPIGYYHSDLSPEQYEQLLDMSKNSHKALD